MGSHFNGAIRPHGEHCLLVSGIDLCLETQESCLVYLCIVTTQKNVPYIIVVE